MPRGTRSCLKKHKTSFYDEVDCDEDCTGDLPAINDLHCSVHPPTDNDATGECSWRFSQVQTSDPDLYKKASRCARRTTTAAEAVACADRLNLPPSAVEARTIVSTMTSAGLLR